MWGSSRQAPPWDEIANTVKKHRIDFIGGEFGLALFKARKALLSLGVEATFLGSWAWRQLRDTRGGGKAIPGFEGLRFDSLGLYAVVPVHSCAHYITPTMLSSTPTPQKPHFCEFVNGPGYGADLYVGAELARQEFEPVVTG